MGTIEKFSDPDWGQRAVGRQDKLLLMILLRSGIYLINSVNKSRSHSTSAF
jgi:hypothetical protein